MNVKEKKLNILFVSTEVAPFAKTGGLADVAGSLPIELVNRGHDVRIVMPKYKNILSTMNYRTDFSVLMNNKKQTCIVKKASIDFISKGIGKAVPIYFIENYEYFDRDYIYGYHDEGERFTFFCKAILEMLPRINFKPDIIHCNDWHTGPVCMLIKEKYNYDFYKKISTIFTIHNLKYQGNFGKEVLQLFDLDDSYFTPDKTEFYGQFSFIKCGIRYADVISTVSETYAKEIQTPEYGEGLEGLLQSRSNNLLGIVNGISYEEFNPETDPRIYRNYSLKTIYNKKENKHSLQRELRLPVKDTPIIGLISRLVDQKGLDILQKVMDEILTKDIQFVALGLGDPKYEEFFKITQERYPDKMSANIIFNTTLAQRIYAGCDMFLMPSRFEPCGLGQIISLRYGTIPIVRQTGGLEDTIKDYSKDNNMGNGFTFKEYSAEALLTTIDRTINVYNNYPDSWENLIRNALKEDFSWSISAEKYIELYETVLKK